LATTRRSALILIAAGLALGAAGTVAGQPIVGKGPPWRDLSPAERQVLAPLEADWDNLDAQRKAKWIGIARRYPNMRPDEQQRVQSQMRSWATLTPEQRRDAREKFKSLNQLPPDKREEVQRKWQEYQSLTPEQRRELANRPPPAASTVKPAPRPQQRPADPGAAGRQ
jgi:hypothetical protein